MKLRVQHILSYKPVIYFQNTGGFPGGSVVKESICQQGDGFNPWSRNIPHAARQLS